jgi:hypothetical protein
VTIVSTGSGFAGRLPWRAFRWAAVTKWSRPPAPISAAPILFARVESNAEALGDLLKRPEVRDCGLFGRPRSHDPRLAIWLDGFDPISVAEWNDPVGLQDARYRDDPLQGATPTNGSMNWLIVGGDISCWRPPGLAPAIGGNGAFERIRLV